MRASLTACAALALALSTACSSEHSGIEATPGFDPIGSEPSSGDGGAGTGSGDVIRLFCEQGCVNLGMACPMGVGVPPQYCTQSCAANAAAYGRCVAEQLAYYICLATTDVECPFFFPQTPGCDPALQALSHCQNAPGPLPE